MTTLAPMLFAAVAALATPTATLERAAPQRYTIGNATMACTVLDRRETRWRGKHLFLCLDLFGTVRGAVLASSGRVVCEVRGTYRNGCSTLTGCVTTTNCS